MLVPSGIHVAACTRIFPTRKALPPALGATHNGCSVAELGRLRRSNLLPSRETSAIDTDASSSGSGTSRRLPVPIEIAASWGLPLTRAIAKMDAPSVARLGKFSGPGGPSEIGLPYVIWSISGLSSVGWYAKSPIRRMNCPRITPHSAITRYLDSQRPVAKNKLTHFGTADSVCKDTVDASSGRGANAEFSSCSDR